MKDRSIRLYQALPVPARSVVASLRGGYLRAWRYGRETDSLVAGALERDSWAPGKWKIWQEDRLARILHHGATRVPFYREQWAKRRREGDRSSWEDLKNWPILKKDLVRENPARFISDECDSRRMFREHTSGTSGKPLTLWWSKKTVRAWYALFQARARLWYGVSREDRWASLGGQPVVGSAVRKPPYWVHNIAMKQLYLSGNHVSRANTPAYVDALNAHRPTHLVAYPSSTAVLAKYVRELGLQVRGLRTVITNAEPLLPWQREAIQDAFGSEVRETYGMAEIVANASECECGSLHSWPEVGWLEVLDDEEDLTLPDESVGRLIGTSLLNEDMPLIRYEIGDRGFRPPDGAGCACGRGLPRLGGIEGRTNDCLITRAGRSVYWLNPVFYGLPVREAQIVQETLDLIRVNYVGTPDFTAADSRLITERLQMRMGPIEVQFSPVDAIPVGVNGKFQAVVCRVAAGDRAAAACE